MADNKQYITQPQEKGVVMISEDVVATIAAHALSEIEGFAGVSTKPGADIAELIGKKNWGKGVKVSISDDNVIALDCNVMIYYGHSVVDVAKSIQASVTAAVESTTGNRVSSVNVNICGIIRK